VESRFDYTDDGRGVFIEEDALAHHVCLALEPFAPHRIADHNRHLRIGSVVRGAQGSAQHRAYAEDVEVVRGDQFSTRTFRHAAGLDVGCTPPEAPE
jgi:hypothetical protein